MQVITTNNHLSDPIVLDTLVDIDNVDEWAVRYVFMKHQNNDEFIANYFSKGNMPNLNVRKITSERVDLWKPHNLVFTLSEITGDLIWRVKVHNKITQSIDYVEVWKNKKVIIDYFFSNDNDSILPDNTTWTSKQKQELSKMVYDYGFIANSMNPVFGISKKQAIQHYNNFVTQSVKQGNCIINTKFNQAMHS